MGQLKRWLGQVFGSSSLRSAGDENLPFTPEEFARLIASGNRQDMRVLAVGLSLREKPLRASAKASDFRRI
jgi:hypothetical protein